MTILRSATVMVQTSIDLDAPVTQDVLTQAEYEAFRDALPNWRDRLIAMLLRNTGLRINEVLGLLVKECVLDGPASIIYVHRSKKRTKILKRALKEIDRENMPPWYYLVLHPGARISDDDRSTLGAWVTDGGS